METFLLLWALFAFVSAAIWSSKGGSGFAGFMLGALLGVFGLVYVAAATPSVDQQVVPSRECPFCREAMKAEASVCPHCQRDSDPWRFHEGRWWISRGGEWLWYDQRSRSWREYAQT